MSVILYTIISVVLVSLVSLLGVLALAFHKKKLDKILLLLVSLSAGTLFGGALLHLIPEAVEESGFTITISLYILFGVVAFFILEKFIHRHEHEDEEHGKRKSIGVMNLAGDGVHNFLDGLIIAAAYFISVPVGIATTIAVVLHEVPQEIADFGVLLYAGFTKKKALLYNFGSAFLAVLGAVVGLILGTKMGGFISFIVPFAAGGFLYIAGANLVPELHKHCKLKDDLLHIMAMVLGIAIMVGLLFIGH